MSIDPGGIDWLGRGWLLLLAFSAAVLLVAALRQPCRRWFGTECAFQLWLLPPLAMLASQLPHPAATPVVALPSVIYEIATVASVLPVHATAATTLDWRAAAMLLWLVGTIAALLLAAAAQWRYRRRLTGATPMIAVALRWPVLQATGVDVGPALVGAWRARIVLPADFDTRYDAAERALILAHEATHARRGDGWWCLCAQIVAAVFWFHPLAWWALAALRHDQELACDAAVLREHGASRRRYADAMLKTQSAAFALPVGCPWSPRHPVTERIAMLKLKQPAAIRRFAGAFFVGALVAGVASAVYATTPSPQTEAAGSMRDRYTLKIDAGMAGRPDSMHFTRCLKPGEPTTVNGSDTHKFSWQGQFTVSPAAGGQLEIRSHIDTRFEETGGYVHTQSAQPIVRTMPGQQAVIQFGQVHLRKQAGKPDDRTIKVSLTPTPGCSSGTVRDGGMVPAGKSGLVMARGAAADAVAAPREYQLNLSVALATNLGRGENVRRANLALCTNAGKTATVKVHDWQIDVTPMPEGTHRLRLDVHMSGADHQLIAQASLQGAVDGVMHAGGKSIDGKSDYSVDITSLDGCPARAEEAERKSAHA